jgi:hypothetical protein
MVPGPGNDFLEDRAGIVKAVEARVETSEGDGRLQDILGGAFFLPQEVVGLLEHSKAAFERAHPSFRKRHLTVLHFPEKPR